MALSHKLEQFAAIGLLEYVNEDTRPTFVIDLRAQNSNPTTFLFRNRSLIKSKTLLSIIERELSGTCSDSSTHGTLSDFKTWVNDRDDDPNVAAARYSLEAFGLLWTATTVQHRWKVISGIAMPEAKPQSFPCEQSSSSPFDTPRNRTRRASGASLISNVRSNENKTEAEARGRFPFETPLSQHRRWVQEFDWGSTPVGAIETWPPVLRQACDMMLATPGPVAIIWGIERIMIYNESYIQICKDKHPRIMGGSGWLHFGEFWEETIEPIVLEVTATGVAYKSERLRLLIERSGFMEEAFFAFTYLPMFDGDRDVVGIYAQVFEISSQVVVERRMYTLLKISEGTAVVTSLPEFWRLLVSSLEDKVYDVPFAAVYSVGEEEMARTPGVELDRPKSKLWVLEGAIGFPPNHPAIPAKLDVQHSMDGFAPSFRLAIQNERPTLLHTDGAVLEQSLLRDLDDRGVEFHCDEIVACPLFPTTDDEIFGCFVLGINPTRPYDDDYRRFMQLLSRQIENTVASVIPFEREKRRLRATVQQATSEQQMLSKQLQVRTREVRESERKFKRFVERAPVGIITVDPEGSVIFCNDSGYDLLGMSGEAKSEVTSRQSWMQSIFPDDHDHLQAHWKIVVEEQRPVTFEFRVSRPWSPPSDASTPIQLNETWILSNAYPDVSEEGILTITAVLSNISHQKWAESIQLRQLSEALESKRQQENFMDMTSHEMRNPLHAILQCAEEITNVLQNLKRNCGKHDNDIEDCLEAAQTILYCGDHQKRIIDDILILSKLDLNLLALAPVEVKPADVVKQVLKIFETELRVSDIATHVSLGPSYQEHALHTVMMDDSRIIQVLINLISNAIKFTKDRPWRMLDIALSCSTERPHDDVGYVPSGRPRKDLTQQAEWGEGDVIYLHFSVRDTGPGLSEDVMNVLFARFRQASPRTHVQYGGSGLGLFISRELVELHGGEIGLASRLGYGSTFAFYVKARRAINLSCNPNLSADSNSGDTAMASEILQKEWRLSGDRSSDQPSDLVANLTGSMKCGVLLVEDNLINQRVLAKQLRKLGYVVYTANHGEEALTILRSSTWWQGPPVAAGKDLSVVLMDIEMPIMDGKTCIRKLRGLQQEGALYHRIPVIAVTGNARAQQIEDAMECGFDDVVSKPYRVADLIPQIDKFAE